GRQILVVLLAVQDQADIDVEQAQQAALVGIVVGDGGQEGRRRRNRAIAGGLGSLLVAVDRVLFTDGLAEEADLAGLDRGGEGVELVADVFLVEHCPRAPSKRKNHRGGRASVVRVLLPLTSRSDRRSRSTRRS